METFVYGDVILLENLVMNYLILYTTAKFARTKHHKLKFFLSALLGSIYAVISYFPQYHFLYTPVMKILFSLFIVVLAFTPTYLREFAKITGVFYIVSFIFGGAAFGIFYFINGLSLTFNGISFIEHFPVKTLLLSLAVAYVCVKYCWDYIQYRIKRERIITAITISFNNQKAELDALIDTGNSLSEPLTNTPVIVVEYSAIKYLLPEEIRIVFDENKQDDLGAVSSAMSTSEWLPRFRVIPFKSLGRDHGMLLGFKPDEMLINDNDQTLNIKNIVIAIYNKKLSRDGEYFALVHPDIMAKN